MTGNTTDARDVRLSIYCRIHQILELIQLRESGRDLPEDADKGLATATDLRELVKQLYGIKNASEAQPDAKHPATPDALPHQG